MRGQGGWKEPQILSCTWNNSEASLPPVPQPRGLLPLLSAWLWGPFGPHWLAEGDGAWARWDPVHRQR